MGLHFVGNRSCCGFNGITHVNEVSFVNKYLKDQSCMIVFKPPSCLCSCLRSSSAPNEDSKLDSMLQSPESWQGMTLHTFLQSQISLSADI